MGAEYLPRGDAVHLRRLLSGLARVLSDGEQPRLPARRLQGTAGLSRRRAGEHLPRYLQSARAAVGRQGTARRGRHFDRHADAVDCGHDVLQDDQGDVPECARGGRRQRGHAVARRAAEAGTVLHGRFRYGDPLRGRACALVADRGVERPARDGLRPEPHLPRCDRPAPEQGHPYREDDRAAAAGLRRFPARSLLRAGADHSLSGDPRLLLGPLHVLRSRSGLFRPIPRDDRTARRRSSEGVARQVPVPALPVLGRVLSAGVIQKGFAASSRSRRRHQVDDADPLRGDLTRSGHLGSRRQGRLLHALLWNGIGQRAGAESHGQAREEERDPE